MKGKVNNIGIGQINDRADIEDLNLAQDAGFMTDDKLYTIGYGNRKPDELIKILKDAGVRFIIDVRRHDSGARLYQYRPGEPIQKLLNEHGIGYEHWSFYGNYFRNDWPQQYKRFLHRNREQINISIDDIFAIGKPTCLLCAEIDHAKCHRSILADKLAEILGDDWKVVHL